MKGRACARLCSGKLACTFSLRTKAFSSVPSLHVFSKHLFVVFLGSEIVEIDAGSATRCAERSSAQAEQSAPQSKRRQATKTGTRTRNNVASVAKRQYLDGWYQSLTSSLFFLAKELERKSSFLRLGTEAPDRRLSSREEHGRLGMCFFVSGERVLPSLP